MLVVLLSNYSIKRSSGYKQMLTFPNTPKPQISSGVTIIQQQTTESDKVLPNHVIQGTFTYTGMMTATPSTQLLKTRFVVH